MTNGNDELSDDAKGRGVTVQECEGGGVRWRWGAKGLECDGAAPRKGPGATVRDGAGWCGTALDGTTGRKRAQPGATGRNRAQKGSRRLANPVKLGAPPALCGRVEQICTEAARAAAQRRRRELLKGR